MSPSAFFYHYCFKMILVVRGWVELEDDQVWHLINFIEDFPGTAVVKNPPANAGDTGSIPGSGRSHMLQSS